MGTNENLTQLLSHKETKPSIAKKRLEMLFDEGSFVELAGFNKLAAVVTGFGTIDGKLVYAYSQEGAVDVCHAMKIADVYKNALKMGAPVVGVMDSKGLKMEDGISSFEAYGILFSNQSDASGVVPQISVVLGDCLGTAAFTPMLSDIVIMKKSDAKIFISSPKTFKGFDAKTTNYDDLGGAASLSENTSFVDLCFDDDEGCLAACKNIINLLPSNNMEEAICETSDDINREDSSLDAIIPDNDEAEINIQSIIKSISDNNSFTELKAKYAPEMIIGFSTFNGATIGVVANNGLLSNKGVDKAACFINLCDAFNVPVLSLTDICGYKESVYEHQQGLIRNSAKLLHAFKNSTVPKVNILLRNAIGNAYLLMNSKHIGADVVYAWPSAKIALMDKKAYVNVMGISSEEFEENSNVFNVAAKGYIDDIIIPAATRKRVIAAFEMLSSKRIAKTIRKHSSIQF